MYKSMHKMRRKKGFTLMEMLIVVAIIAILVAIAVPTMTAKLNEAAKTVDEANLRTAVSMASVEYLTEGETGAKTYKFAMNDSKALEITTGTSIAGYNQSAVVSGAAKNTKHIEVSVTVNSEGKVSEVKGEWK